MRSSIFVLLFALPLIVLGCAKQHPLILNVNQEPIPANIEDGSYTMDQVEQTILAACRNKGWAASLVEPGKIIASITIRTRHRAKISIEYTTTHYSISYMESSGLDYRNGRIHSNYNHWIARLDAEIKKEFGLKTQRY